MKTYFCGICQVYAIALNYGLDPVFCTCGRLMREVDLDEE